MSSQAGKVFGWLGIIIGVIGFFWQPLWMGIIALVCGIIGLFSEEKTLNWVAVAAGVIALIIYYVQK